MKTSHNNLPTSPSSIKNRFAIRFIRAMKKLNKNRPMATKEKRSHLIKTAAYASMASAVGPRRAWSRALLRKIKTRTTRGTDMRRRRRRRVVMIINRGNPRRRVLNFDQENNLRELVPGGEAMDSCRLLIETAHYIKCLRAQVQVMRNIADHFSK